MALVSGRFDPYLYLKDLKRPQNIHVPQNEEILWMQKAQTARNHYLNMKKDDFSCWFDLLP